MSVITGRTYCMSVIMGGPIVRQLQWEDLLYVYCMSVIMGGPIVHQL